MIGGEDKVETFYRIQDSETGLFSTGGENPNWTKNGKIWKITGLRKHTALIRDKIKRTGFNPYKNADVVVYSVKPIRSLSLENL